MDLESFFYFKGDRNYIQAGNILDSILDTRRTTSPRDIDFSLSSITDKTWHLMADRAQAGTRNIIGKYKDDSSLVFVVDAGNEVTERRPYDEAWLASSFELRATVVRVPDRINNYSFMEKLICAFKALLSESLFPEKLVRYIFVRIILDHIPSDGFIVRYKRKVGGKFFEGEITEQNNNVGFVYFLGQENL
jgi:hypothetical protein